MHNTRVLAVFLYKWSVNFRSIKSNSSILWLENRISIIDEQPETIVTWKKLKLCLTIELFCLFWRKQSYKIVSAEPVKKLDKNITLESLIDNRAKLLSILDCCPTWHCYFIYNLDDQGLKLFLFHWLHRSPLLLKLLSRWIGTQKL